MDHVSTILGKVLKKRGLHSHAEASLIVKDTQNWLQEHMAALAERIRVQKYTDGVLHLTCTDSIALQELHEHTIQLQEYLRANNHAELQDVRCMRA